MQIFRSVSILINGLAETEMASKQTTAATIDKTKINLFSLSFFS